jgi:hypothetical protein
MRRMRLAGYVACIENEKFLQNVDLMLQRKTYVEDLGVDERALWILEKQVSIHLTQGRDQWRVLVNTIMNIWVSKRRGIS